MDVVRPDPPRRSLRRSSDRIEDAVAWLVSALALITVVLGFAVGEAGYSHAMDRVRAETAERTVVRAVLLEPAVLDGSQQVRAHWTGPDGVAVSGDVPVRDPRPAGAEVRVWLDREGRVADAPLREPVALALGWVRGSLATVCGWALLALLWVAVRRAVDRRNAAAWERDWARVGPAWSGRS